MNLAKNFVPYSVTPFAGRAVAARRFDRENFKANIGVDESSVDMKKKSA